MARPYLLLIAAAVIASCNKQDKPGPQINDFTPRKGAFNNQVIIRGLRFDSSLADTRVSFGGANAMVTSVSDTQIIATVPANATTGAITVSVRAGATNSAGNFEILPGKWTRKADMPGAGRQILQAFSIGTKGYVFAGADGGGTLDDFYEYDQLTNSWKTLPKPGFRLEGGVAVVVNGKAYIGAGSFRDGTAAEFLRWRMFDPASGSWTTKADFPGTARYGSVGLTDGQKIYVGLGVQKPSSSTSLYDWWAYDPATDAWTRKADNPATDNTNFQFAAGFTLNGKMYMGLGAYGQKNLWNYDPPSNAWTRMADFPGTAFYGASGFSLNGKGYICGGGGSTECWRYDPETKNWTQVAFFGPSSSAGSFVIGNKAYIACGNLTNQLWEFEQRN